MRGLGMMWSQAGRPEKLAGLAVVAIVCWSLLVNM